MRYDSVIVGAGQSGLYAAKALAQKNKHYLVLERDDVGQVWQQRLDGMLLFTSRQFCALPGLTFPGDPQGFPTTEEVAAYLKEYARTFKLNIQSRTRVISVTQEKGYFIITTDTGLRIETKTLINATGSNQQAKIPGLSKELPEQVQQFSADVTNLDSIKDGWKVAIIGDGASGRQIAAQLASRCDVSLACGQRRGLPPNRVLGKDIFWWLAKLGIIFAGNGTLVSKVLKKRNPVPLGNYTNNKLKKAGVTICQRLIECQEETLKFANGHQQQVDAVIWATGYQDDTSWLHIEGCHDENGFIQQNGQSPTEGLFVVGRKWLSCRASELIMGVERDVDHVMTLVERELLKHQEVEA